MNPAVNFPPTFSLLKAEDDQDIYSLKLSECKIYCCLLSAVHASYTEIYNGPEGWDLATPGNHIFSEAYLQTDHLVPAQYNLSTAHQPF